MTKQKDKEKSKRKRSTWINISGLLCIGFTGVSLWNQSEFYYHKYGLGMALLIGFTLEAARLNSLDSMFPEKVKFKNPAVYIYIIVALWCFTANSIAFVDKSIAKNDKSITEITNLWRKVAKYKIELIDNDLSVIKKETHQNAGMLGIDENNKRIKGFNEDWKKRKSELIEEKLKIVYFNSSNSAKISQQILLHGSDGHISTLNDISYRNEDKNVSFLFFEISPVKFWLWLQIALAALIELLILYFAWRSKAVCNSAQFSATETQSKSDNLQSLRNYLRDPDCKKWHRNFVDKSIVINRDGNGWQKISTVTKGKHEKFKEFRDFCNQHPESLEKK